MRADEQIYDLIRHMPEADQIGLAQKMLSIENLLTGHRNVRLEDIVIRHAIKQGDAGYLTYMHGWIYAQEYNYSTVLEGYVAQSFYEFLANYDPRKDRLWIAEYAGEIVGSIGIVGHGDRAQLRWFLLHPGYRGIGLGKYMLNDSIEFWRRKGFKKVYPCTNSDLETAINMYKKAGFVKVAEKENNTWRTILLNWISNWTWNPINSCHSRNMFLKEQAGCACSGKIPRRKRCSSECTFQE